MKNIYVPAPGLLEYLNENNLSFDQIKQRKCWECGSVLNFREYCSNCSQSSNHLDKIAYFIEIWQSDYIELYCCSCFCQTQMRNLKKPARYMNPGKLFI